MSIPLKNNFIPKYKQIYEDIKQSINEQYEVGDRLPSEVDLINKYKVSRSTLRRSLKLLADDGLILIKHGKGMFVKSPGIQINTSDVMNFDGFYELLAKEGLEPNIKLLTSDQVIPPKYVADVFGCSEEQKIHLIHRKYSLKTMPIGVFFTYFSPEINLSETLIERLKSQPIRPLIQNEVIESDAIRYNIEFKNAPADIAEQMNLSTDDMVVVVNQTIYKSYENEFIPFEISTIYLTPEMSKFSFFMKK